MTDVISSTTINLKTEKTDTPKTYQISQSDENFIDSESTGFYKGIKYNIPSLWLTPFQL